MTREEFIKQRCEIDKITEEEFEKRYRVVKCNCGQPYCKGYRCLDLDGLLRENQKYKEVIDKLNFIKNRKNQGASQENINKMAIEFVDSYLKEVE